MGDLTSFVMEFLHLLDMSAKNVCETLIDKKMRYDQFVQKIRQSEQCPSDELGKKILRFLLEAELFDTPGVPTDRLATETKSSIKTVRNRLQRLGALVSCEKVGRKQHWHINLEALENE